jgi:transcriptional regulator GlxA family with amidase domain
MRKVAILAAKNCVLSTIAAPMDMFLQAGVLWNVTMGEMPDPLFEVKIVTADGNPITAINDVTISPTASMNDIEDVDLVVIPSQGFFFESESTSHANRVDWLKKQYGNGTDLASICAGAFTLASTGLLDGKEATTHWGMARQFKKSFPKVKLRTDLMVTDQGQLFCGGGITADLNLSLYLINKYCGREVALQSSRCTLVDLEKIKQLPFSVFNPEKNHNDKEVLGIQEWIEVNCTQDINLEVLAAKMGLSLRQFNRRFKSATGETAIKYLQQIRVERAKRELIATKKTFDAISLNSGYENVSFFRRIFKINTGISPAQYRNRFSVV